MLLAYSAGATVGPFLMALVMDLIGLAAFFGYVSVVALLLAFFVLHRMRAREALPVAEQGAMVVMPPRLSPVVNELDPRLEGEPQDTKGASA
jgi:hypothetical protein